MDPLLHELDNPSLPPDSSKEWTEFPGQFRAASIDTYHSKSITYVETDEGVPRKILYALPL
jgi:hypothetical protein